MARSLLSKRGRFFMMKQVHYPSRGQTVYGYAHVPTGEVPGPALILSHGFTGAAHESSRLFVHFANQACAQGFYVLRMDFLGSGSSDVDEAAYTYLSGWTQDVLAGVDFLRAQPEVDAARIGALGISFGAAATLLAGADARIRAVAGWASVLHPEITFRGILGAENWNALAAGCEQICHTYADKQFTLSRRFLTDLWQCDIVQTVKGYGGKPLLLLQGDQDAVIDPAHATALAAEIPCEFHLIQGEDHSFCVHREQNFATTLDFFRRNLGR